MTSEDVAAFGYLRLAGGRFDVAEGLPVVSAAELERYALLVSAVARELYLRAHPKRQRVPRGFDGAFDLRLTRVGRGSQIPVLVRPTINDGALFQNTDWHENARRLINSALGDIGTRDRVPTSFPPAAIKPLAQFGRSLRANERIELADNEDDPIRAVLTVDTRRRIQQLAKLDELEIETVVVGQVTGLSSTPPHVDVAVPEELSQRKIGATFSDPSVFDSLHSYLGFGETAPPVALSVIAVQNREGLIVKITDVLHVEPALPPAWSERLRELAGLSDDWLHPGSKPPSIDTIERVERILLATLDAEVAAPAIYPSGDGGIQLEWRTSSRAVEVEVANSGGIEASWYGRANDDDGEDVTFLVDDPDGVADFVKDAISE
ncbi:MULTISPECIES: hypothetical protein [Gordonia]|uniref:hypothetical protein n=1 Tax=Gordonia TaxID=2053 RepID=UPI00200B246F|nr:hypothetical protein [Gordonia terrae]UPW08863.1 hypothetical protein M1C59_23015 [Gordonia terrae]